MINQTVIAIIAENIFSLDFVILAILILKAINCFIIVNLTAIIS